jgi:TIR domain-containing protein/YARHG domain-containing protein
MAHDVFVSYSVKDKIVADAIVARLEAESIRCWEAPRDVVPGADWGESIINAIESSRIMVLVFTSSANASPQIKREVERAVDKGVYTIPFRVDNIEPTRALEYFISTAQWMDAFSPPLEPHLASLARTVKAILAGSPPLPQPAPPPPPPVRAPARSGRWMLIAAGLLLVGIAGWYFASHRPVSPVISRETGAATPSATVAQPTASLPDTGEQDALRARQAQEREDREAALRAQLAETQEKFTKMQEESQRRQNETTPNRSGPWLFPDSSSRYLSQDELAGLNAEQLWRARNEIYARNGYRFSSPKGLAFARSLGSYYRGLDPDDDRVFGRMNPYEQANVTLLKSLEPR